MLHLLNAFENDYKEISDMDFQIEYKGNVVPVHDIVDQISVGELIVVYTHQNADRLYHYLKDTLGRPFTRYTTWTRNDELVMTFYGQRT